MYDDCLCFTQCYRISVTQWECWEGLADNLGYSSFTHDETNAKLLLSVLPQGT